METAKKFWQKPFTILVLLAFAVALGALALSMNPQPAEARVGDPLEVFIPCEEVFAKGVHAFDSDVTAPCSTWMPPIHISSLVWKAELPTAQAPFELPVASPSQHDFACDSTSGYQILENLASIRYWSKTVCEEEMANIQVTAFLLERSQDEDSGRWDWARAHSAIPDECDLCREAHSEDVYPVSWPDPILYMAFGIHADTPPAGEQPILGERVRESESRTFVYPEAPRPN